MLLDQVDLCFSLACGSPSFFDLCSHLVDSLSEITGVGFLHFQALFESERMRSGSLQLPCPSQGPCLICSIVREQICSGLFNFGTESLLLQKSPGSFEAKGIDGGPGAYGTVGTNLLKVGSGTDIAFHDGLATGGDDFQSSGG
jgi:hypothetical protein